MPISNSVHRRSAIVSEADSTLPSSLDDEELALGASASPVEPTSSPIPLPLFSEDRVTRNHDSISFYPRMHKQFSWTLKKKLHVKMFCCIEFQHLPHVRHRAMLVS